MCRRCGAPVHSDPETTRVAVPSSLQRRGSVGTGSVGGATGVATSGRPGAAAGDPLSQAASQAAAGAAAAVFRGLSSDTLLPGAFPRPDNLLPRATRPNPTPAPPARRSASQDTLAPSAPRARRGRRVTRSGIVGIARNHWRRILVVVVVGVALTMSVVAVWPVAFSNNSPASTVGATSAAREARATSLLRTVVGGGRTLFAPRHSFAKTSPASLSARSRKVPVVGPGTSARLGQVSMRATTGALILASPADAQRCVFARDEPSKSSTMFVTVSTATCRASSAPARGWPKR